MRGRIAIRVVFNEKGEGKLRLREFLSMSRQRVDDKVEVVTEFRNPKRFTSLTPCERMSTIAARSIVRVTLSRSLD
jgi:hypothetical protein